MSSITRDAVLDAARRLRVIDPSDGADAATATAIRALIKDVVDVSGRTIDHTAYPAAAGSQVDGVMIDVSLYDVGSGDTRSRSFVVLAPVDPEAPMSGTATMSGRSEDADLDAPGTRLGAWTLGGDVFVSDPIDTSQVGALEVAVAVAAAAPAAASAAPTPTSRTPAEIQAARRTYDKALKDAKKKYVKAKKKAGKSKKKKAKAKRTYAKRKATAKARYRAATADIPAAATAPAQVETPSPYLTISTDVGWAVAS